MLLAHLNIDDIINTYICIRVVEWYKSLSQCAMEGKSNPTSDNVALNTKYVYIPSKVLC